MKWISVEDKIPIVCVDILFTDGENIYKGWLETYEDCEDLLFYNEGGSRNAESWPHDITHWMHLPNLPK